MVALATVAVLERLPELPAGTATRMLWLELWPLVSTGKGQLTVPPVAHTAGVVQVPGTLPPVNVAETKVGPIGSTSFNTTFRAVSGPALMIPIWYARFEPAGTGSGLSVLV